MQQYEGQTATGPNGEKGIIRNGQLVVLPKGHPLGRTPGLHQIVAPHQSLPTARDALGEAETRARIHALELKNKKAETEGDNKPEKLTTEDIDLQATLYLADQKSIAALGYNKVARSQIVHRATELAHQWGMSAADILAGRAKLKAGEFAYRHFLDRQQQMEAFAQTAVKNGKLALDLARQVQAQGGNTGIVPFNRWLHSGMRSTGNVQVDQLYAQLKTTADEYAKITSSVTGSGTSADSAMQRSEAIFDGAKTLDQLAGIINGVMVPDIHNRTSSNSEQLTSIIEGVKQSDPGMAARLKKEAATVVKAPEDLNLSGNTNGNLKRLTPQQLDTYKGIVADAARTNNPSMIDAYMKGIGLTGAKNGKDIIAHYKAHNGEISDIIDDSANARHRAEEVKARLDATGRGAGGTKDVMTHSATMGLDRPVAGAVNAVSKALGGDFSIGDNYAAGRDAQGLRLEEASKNVGGAAVPLEIAGGFAGANPAEAGPAVAKTLGGLVRQGAKVGGGVGAFSGFNNGTGFGDSVKGAIGGGIMGGVLGAAIPAGIHGVAEQSRGLSEIVKRIRQGDPKLALKMVAESLKHGQITHEEASAILADAHAAGQKMTIADLGNGPRALGASLSRYPEGRESIERFVTERQEGQGDRIRGAIEKHLGPVADVLEESRLATERAKAAAKPLYAKAYWADGAANFANRPDIQALLKRPSMQKALKGALTLAAEEGRSPNTLGLIERPDGSVELGKGLSWRSLDYIKRGLDGTVEGAVNHRGGLTPEGKAFYGTLREFRDKMKAANPAYGEALKSYSDPAQLRDAMEMGHKALKLNQSQLGQITRDYSPAQMEQFKLGFRSSLAEALDAKGDGANKVLAVLGDPKKRKALGHLFGDQQEFGGFVKFLHNEHAMSKTYSKVTGNSLSAERILDDVRNSDQALQRRATGVIDVLKDGRKGVMRHVMGKVDDTVNFGNSSNAESARKSAASVLFTPDRNQFVDVVGDIAARNRQAANSGGALRELIGRVQSPALSVTGNALGQWIGGRWVSGDQ